MIDYIFLKSLACFVDVIHAHLRVVGIYFAPAFVYRHEHRFDARRCACEDADGSCRCYCKTGDVAPAFLLQQPEQFGIGFCQTLYERIVFLPFEIVDLESTSFSGHYCRGAVGCECKRAVHAYGEFRGFGCAVAQAHGGNHVAFGSSSYSGASAFQGLFTYFHP